MKKYQMDRWAQRRSDALVASTLKYILLCICCVACSSCTTDQDFDHSITTNEKPWKHEQFDNAPEKVQFAIFSDLTGGEREKIFEVAVAQLNLLRPEMIINVGDLVEGGSNDKAELNRQWDWFDQRAGKAKAPLFYMGGNHDLTGEVLREVWTERHGPRYYHFVYRNILFLVLDTEDNSVERMREIEQARREAVQRYKSEGPEAFANTEYARMPERTAGTIGKEQSDYFKRIVAESPEVMWAFVFLHKPAWEKENEQHFSAIEAALSDRPYTVFHGHTQYYNYTERFGRDYINLATTGGEQFPQKGRSMDHIMWVTVDEDGVSIANLLLTGILDKTGHVPLNGDELEFEKEIVLMPLENKKEQTDE